MIAVIADDLTGAAELGGVGLTYGLNVELTIGLHSASASPQSTAELLVVATDARSVSEPEAVQEMTNVSAALQTMKPRLIFKKVDSVLRGHVIAETKAQLAVLGLGKALIVPANPALGRTLINGHYYVQGELIHQTHFSNDPEFPITESNVQKRLSTNDVPITIQSSTEALLPQGITIGEVGTQDNLKTWASRIDEQTLPGGGAGFFSATLESLGLFKSETPVRATLGECRLYVCGSAFGERVTLVQKAVNAGHSVQYMPEGLMYSAKLDETVLKRWVTEIVASLRQRKQAIIAIAPNAVGYPDAVQLRTRMARAVKQVFDRVSVDELFIEGGSTASAVLREMTISRLTPTEELASGVVRNAVIGNVPLHITVKPGSYRWPSDLWPFDGPGLSL